MVGNRLLNIEFTIGKRRVGIRTMAGVEVLYNQKLQTKPKRHAKLSTKGPDLQVQSVRSPMQPSPERKQISCGKDPARETARPGIVGSAEHRISTDYEGSDNKRRTWCICIGEDDGDLMIECS